MVKWVLIVNPNEKSVRKPLLNTFPDNDVKAVVVSEYVQLRYSSKEQFEKMMSEIRKKLKELFANEVTAEDEVYVVLLGGLLNNIALIKELEKYLGTGFKLLVYDSKERRYVQYGFNDDGSVVYVG